MQFRPHRYLTILSLLVGFTLPAAAKNVAYIYGDVAADGSIPSGSAAPYDQMLLTDTGNTGCSQFRSLVEAQGYQISQHYDVNTTLNASFLGQFDVIIFGLHQKDWTTPEKAALDLWIRAGGGVLIYSDSASGGLFSSVGINNTEGQSTTNNLISQYGMEVTFDQGGGTRAYQPDAGSSNPIIWDQPIFEGEGVSPVAVDTTSGAQVLIPLDAAHRVSGNSTLSINSTNVTISNPQWAVIALREVDRGNVIVTFDRQPMWNNGPGSDINEEDNTEILRRIIRYLARDYANSSEWFQQQVASLRDPVRLEMTYRQWSGGTGATGVDYAARNNQFSVQYKSQLDDPSWLHAAELATQFGATIDNSDETETVTVRLSPPTANASTLFARVSAEPSITLVVDAGQDRVVGETGAAYLSGAASSPNITTTWSKASGPGSITFVDSSSLETTASFSAPGDYVITLSVNSGSTSEADNLEVTVVDNTKIVRAINCGNISSGFVGSNGFTYEADTLFSGGHIDNFSGNLVANTEDDDLYNYARSNVSSYAVPVPNGNYIVYLQYSETYFTANNKRVFDTSIEGTLVLDDHDLHAVAPGKHVAYDRIFTTTIADGALNLSFTASINNSLLSAFVIIEE